MSGLDDFYEAQTFNDERNGIPAPVAAVGVSRAMADFESFMSMCSECDGPVDDDAEEGTRLCASCRAEWAAFTSPPCTPHSLAVRSHPQTSIDGVVIIVGGDS